MNNNFMCFPNGKLKALTFSYDDGEKQDIRLAQLFNKYGLKCTFNLNSGLMPVTKSETHSKVSLEEIPTVYEGHEVAVHTSHHPFLERIPVNIAISEILGDKQALEKYTGYIVRGMAYPFGTYNNDVLRILKDIGIKYSRGVGAHHRFSIPTKWLEMDTTCHHAEECVFELAEEFVNKSPLDNWKSLDGWLFYIWGHSYEYRTEADWERMERLCQKLSSRDDVWYATNIEIYDYVEAYRSLEYSVDFNRVYNPSAKDVWMIHNGKTIKIPTGKEIEL
ncbi:MAG: polysaccharide deacetylase family protein [Clostridia bacterium]|nr:polysaccharide deacetylase family protein [Clostridia bacterium]